MQNYILNFFSKNISQELEEILNLETEESLNELEEIRLRLNKPIILKFNTKEIITGYIVTTKDLINSLQIICENSIYSYQKEICQGFITIRGGHRIRNDWKCCYGKWKSN